MMSSLWRRASNYVIIITVVYFSCYAVFTFIDEEITTCDSAVGLAKLLLEDVDQKDHQQVVNHQRRMTVAKYCRDKHTGTARILKPTDWNHLNIYKKPRLYYTDKLELIFCEVPKCGSTQWRNLMLITDGHIEGYAADNLDRFELSWEKNLLWSKYNARNHASAIAVDKRLKGYYKIMTTREPLQRLVSAYRDKLESGAQPFYLDVSKKIHKAMNPNSEDGLASFEEFIDHILSTEDVSELDPHWKPYSALCDPCKIHYDYIARMETLYADTTAISKVIGISQDRLFNDTGMEGVQQRRTALTNRYFEKLPYSKRLAIFLYYKDQYDMFGYDYPNFIKAPDGPISGLDSKS